ncbi:hypothetical protein KI688_004221 [Linnemannia hyalina]|uniref:Uncharacterized protein n=1 Tax=Linnemannia hyalina TaxID=64524 RepID=A0A9P8BP00_9FUNG|nr:hypothetical protein KI688_004221 [Linnemannia hyalina]
MHTKTKIHLTVAFALAILQVVGSAPPTDCPDLPLASAAALDTEDKSGRVYRWIAIGCGAVINIIIGGYAGLTNILETEGRWTQRLEFVKDESKWWTGMSTIVLVAFAMDLVAFSKGESVDATILLLAAEVGIVIFIYVVQGTLHAEFRHLLWLAWTGNSRTGCGGLEAAMMTGLITDRQRLSLMTMTEKRQRQQPVAQFESSVDIPGYGAVLSPKIKQDLVAVLKHRAENMTTTGNDHKTAPEVVAEIFTEIGSTPSAKKFIYPPHQVDQTKMSILWGGRNCGLFSPRVSRGITGYTLDRIRSSYSLVNVDESKWMFVAGGIVARNKGLNPARMICGLTITTEGATGGGRGGGEKEGGVSTAAVRTTVPEAAATATTTLNIKLIDEVETTSKWRPRQAKSSRSRYAQESNAQFSGLGQPFCTSVVEIALLMQDIPNRIVVKALLANVEQQSCEKMWRIQALFDSDSSSNSSSIVIQDAMYVCQYMTFCAKLNWYGKNDERPDLIMGLLYASFKNLDWAIGHADEGQLSIILREELRGLDLGVMGEKTVNILVCLGAYLGIEATLRQRVIDNLFSKFATDGAVQIVLSEGTTSSTVQTSNAVHLYI